MELIQRLTETDAQNVECDARNKLNEYGKLNDVIGSQIFAILGRYSRVLYYPLEDDDVWGFVEKTANGTFVCINTSLSYEKQVFVAAHELYHILHETPEELTLAKNLEESATKEPIQIEELKANRFAAAFLVDAGLLRHEMNVMKISSSTLNVQGILSLANLFMVPYKTMARRLFELEIITESQLSEYLKVSGSDLEIMKKRLGLLTPIQDKTIVLDNLVETAMSLYEKEQITVEKLEQVLRYANMNLSDMGISSFKSSPLTDAELEALLEE